MQSIEGRTVVVTGGASGIGRALVLAFAEVGANVVVADIEGERAEEVASEAAALGVRALSIPTDVSDLQSVRTLADRSYREFGTVHILCNNAGVLLMVPVPDLIVEDWQWILAVNVMGVVHGIHAFLPRMSSSGEPGHILNTSSVAGVTGGGVYGASKAAVLAISEGLRHDLALLGIGVSVLCPGSISSRINSSQRNRPAALGRKAPEPYAHIVDFGLDPMVVGRRAVKAVRADEFYVFVFPEDWGQSWKASATQRFESLLVAIEQGSVPGDDL